jgi:hypothetical protein
VLAHELGLLGVMSPGTSAAARAVGTRTRHARSLAQAIAGGDPQPNDHHGRVDLVPYLRAHSFLRVEWPPALWDADCDDELLIRLTGELIAAALARGNELDAVGLRANNVVVTDAGVPAPGEYVALTVDGAGDWGSEITWNPRAERAPTLVNPDVDAAARAVGIRLGLHARHTATAVRSLSS